MNNTKCCEAELSDLLKKLLPDVGEVINIAELQTKEDLNVIQILARYFDSKRLASPDSDESLNNDALLIQELYPRVDLDSIHEHLNIFRDLPNRSEIVLRLLSTEINERFKITVTEQSIPVKRSNELLVKESGDVPVKIRRTEADNYLETIKFSSEMKIENQSKDVTKVDLGGNSATHYNETVCAPENQSHNFPKNDPVLTSGTVDSDVNKTQATDAAAPNTSNLTETNSLQNFALTAQSTETHPMTKLPTENVPIMLNPIIPITIVKQDSVSGSAVNNVNIRPKGTSKMSSSTTTVDPALIRCLRNVFPDACPNYLNKICENRIMSNETVDELFTIILSANGSYPKRPVKIPEPEIYPKDQFEILTELLPDADPDYLRRKCNEFDGNPELVKLFINDAMEKRDYPTQKDYQRRQQLSAQQKQYTTEFSVENFVKIIPTPKKLFNDSSREIKMTQASNHYALTFLRNMFDRLPIRTIQSCFMKNEFKFYKTVCELRKITEQGSMRMKVKRKHISLPNIEQNIPLLQEIAYVTHEKEIKEYLEEIERKEKLEVTEAKLNGLMKTCNCCFDEEVLPKNVFTCDNGCSFCKSCIIKSTEVLFGEGKLDFPCLMNCSAFFSLQTLQNVLSPKLFSIVAQKKAVAEVKAAGIEELEMCPFCDFATIPAEGDKIFHCLNSECMKESCRSCKEPSHIPLRCDEIERDEEVKARVFVENQMTEALLRKCWKCGLKFFKEEGCNKMTCSCGAQMCYVCTQPVTDYKHFNGNGGDRYDLCPLYSNSHNLNKQNVLKGAQEAKAQIGEKGLKYDPSKDVADFYENRARNLPVENYVPFPLIFRRMQQDFAQQHHH